MTFKEKEFRKYIGEETAKILQKKAPEAYAGQLAYFQPPDYILYDKNGKQIYPPEE